MNLHDKCPFCGAGEEGRNSIWVTFDCHTTMHTDGESRRFQAPECKDAERARLAARVAELERDLEQAKADRARAAMDARNPLMAQLAALEDHCKRLEDAARAVYIDSIVSDHPWTELETRNMHALRDVLEAKQ